MITNGNERMSVGGGFLSVEEFYGLSTDTKPTNTANGSTFFEMDTGKMYRFNYSGATWTETTHYGSDGFGPAPSGGGGGSTGGVLVVHIDEEYSALDKTWQEIHDALAHGTPCVTLYVEDNDVIQGLIAAVSSIGTSDSMIYTVSVVTIQGYTALGEGWQATSADSYPVYISQ